MTTANISATKDSWISADKTTTNNGSDTTLRVSTRRNNATPSVQGSSNSSVTSSKIAVCEVALLGFNLDVIELATSITSATLYIYGGGSVIQAPAIQVCPITDYTWTENGVTWANQPTHNPSIGSLDVYRKSIGTISHTIDGSNHKWQTFDLTSYVRSQNAAAVEAEIMLYPHSGYQFTTLFDSRTGTNAPYIKTVYT